MKSSAITVIFNFVKYTCEVISYDTDGDDDKIPLVFQFYWIGAVSQNKPKSILRNK